MTFFATVFVYLTSCSDSKNIGSAVFNPDQPIEVTGFYPDSGGIATPMIVEGRNFGSDTTNLKVYFEDVDGIKHPAGLVRLEWKQNLSICSFRVNVQERNESSRCPNDVRRERI